MKERFIKEINAGYAIEEISITNFQNGKTAYEKEQSILEKFDVYKYNGPPFLLDGGDSELFTEQLSII